MTRRNTFYGKYYHKTGLKERITRRNTFYGKYYDNTGLKERITRRNTFYGKYYHNTGLKERITRIRFMESIIIALVSEIELREEIPFMESSIDAFGLALFLYDLLPLYIGNIATTCKITGFKVLAIDHPQQGDLICFLFYQTSLSCRAAYKRRSQFHPSPAGVSNTPQIILLEAEVYPRDSLFHKQRHQNVAKKICTEHSSHLIR